MMRVICQFKILTIIVLSFFVLSSKGQIYQVMPQFGYKFNRIAVDSTLHIPSYCGVPSITDYIKNGMIAIDTCNNVLFQWTRSNGWTPISTGTYLDTTSLSNRINQRVKYTDTSAMLNPYLKKIDTTAMLSRYLRKADTTSMLLPYLRKADTAAMHLTYLRKSDTTVMLLPYLRKADTAAMLLPYLRKSDTTVMLLPYLRKADTAAMLLPYLRKSDTTNKFVNNITRIEGKDSIIFYKGSNRYAIKDSIGVPPTRTISTISPLAGGGDLSANRTLSIIQASNNTNGYLSLTDWNTFNSKVPDYRTITINGTSYDLSTNRTWNVGTVTSISQGYGILNSTNPITTTGTITIDSATLSSKYLRVVDTTNKFVNSVTKLNDSTIRVIKGTSTTDITLTPSATVTAATRLVTTAYNNSGATIAKGSVVYINGRHSSNYPTIALSEANNEANSYKTFALVQSDITNGNTGTIIQAGNISNLNLPTSTYSDGDIVYLSPTVAGGITNIKPLAPYHICKIGSVTRAHPTQGSIEIKIENGWQLDELSDVKIATVPLDSTILQFSRVDSLWHDVNPTTAMGNRFVRNISRVAGKDSIIFTIGSTRYAIKDSVGGSPAGSNGYVQFNNSGSFGADSSLFWNNTNKRLGVGTNNPQVPLDIGGGSGPRFLLYGTGGSPQYIAGLGVNLGQASNSMGFFTGANSPFTIEQANTLENFPYEDGYATRFIVDVGGNVGIGNTAPNALLDVSGTANIYETLTTQGARVKHINSFQDDGNADYYVSSNDHILIINFTNNNVNIHLPNSPENGREIIIKGWGDVGDYYTSIYAGEDNYIVVGNTYYGSTQPVDILHDTEPNSVTLIYDGTIGYGVWFILNGQVQ